MRVALALAACFLLSSFLPTHATVLEGFVQHNVVNKPLTSRAADKTIDCSDAWYRIPGWLAGTWHRSVEEQVFALDCTDGSVDTERHQIDVDGQFLYGLQRDANGDIWQSARVPVSSELLRVDHAGAYYEETGSRAVNISQDSITIESQGREYRTTGDGFKTCSWQQQTIKTISRLSDDRVLIKGTIRCYDNRGGLLSVNSNQAVVTRVEPFHQTNRRGEKDLRVSFEQYLQENGHSNLIPSLQVAGLN